MNAAHEMSDPNSGFVIDRRGKQLELHSDLLALRSIGPWVRSLLEADGVGDVEAELAPMELALHELAVNIVTHGYGGGEGTIRFSARRLDRAWEITVTDEAGGFDPDSASEPTEPQVHGYGLMIVRQLTRVFEHRREGGRNITTLVFAVAEGDTPPSPDEASIRDGGLRLSTSTSVVTTAMVQLSGRLDSVTAPDLRRRLSEITDAGTYRVTVDLADVEFVDSSGLAALVASMRVCRDHEGDLELVRPRNPNAHRVFELTKFDAVFTIRPPLDKWRPGT